jgi:hypothetical protein
VKVIARGRQAGKTYALVQWVREGEETDSYPGWSRVLICHSLDEAMRIHKEHDLDYRQVFSAAGWKNARLGRTRVEIAVDNADLVLMSYFEQSVAQISVTGSAE